MSASTPWPVCGRTPVRALVIPRVGDNPALALARLDDLADGADFVLGHNVIGFDLPRLQAANPRLRLLDLPAVDTLRLNPLGQGPVSKVLVGG